MVLLFRRNEQPTNVLSKDPVVCVNVLTLFYENGRGHEVRSTLDWVESVLVNRAYISGTSYYVGADQFLFFFSRFLRVAPEVRRRLAPTFKERVLERFGVDANPLSLAARILAAAAVEIVDQRDLETLLALQCEDGSWDNGWFYRYGASDIFIRNDGVTTAFAIRAIQEVEILQAIQSKSVINTLDPLSVVVGHLLSLRHYFGF